MGKRGFYLVRKMYNSTKYWSNNKWCEQCRHSNDIWNKTRWFISEGSVLEPLLFNIDLIDLFFECDDSEIASYADNTTPYSCNNGIPSVIAQLQSTASKPFSWFTNNDMKVNPGKRYILLSTKISIDVHLEGACNFFYSVLAKLHTTT